MFYSLVPAFGQPLMPESPEPLYQFLSLGPISDVQDISDIMASSCSAYFTALQGSELLPNEFNYLVASSVVVRRMQTGAKF